MKQVSGVVTGVMMMLIQKNVYDDNYIICVNCMQYIQYKAVSYTHLDVYKRQKERVGGW